jgi:uncharacterized protein (TIGR03435 family)
MLLASELGATNSAPALNPEMKNTKVLVGVMVLAALVVMVKWCFFPAIQNDYFALNGRSLQQVPASLVVLRPTRFPFLRHENPTFAPAPRTHDSLWIVGRNAPLREVIAAAYDQYPARVELPPDAPKGNFDFLVTVNHHAQQRLQSAIRQKLGYSAQTEIHETPVLALKVVNPGLPGLTLSDASEPRGVRFDDIKLHFANMPVAAVPEVLKRFFALSVVDKTGLTNFYDYALQFDASTRRQMHDEATACASADKVVQELGLGLEPDLEFSEVLVVKTAAPAPPVFADRKRTLLGPVNPGAEEGSEYWYHDFSGNGSLSTDRADPAAGVCDFTLVNSNPNRQSHADWRSEIFSLGPATKGAVPLRFSFAYKLPGPVKDGDNLRVQLRFFDQATNFLDQKVFFVGSSTRDSAMTGYKTITADDLPVPAGSRFSDLTISANQYDDRWSSGTGRFDNLIVTIKKTPAAPFKRFGLAVLSGLAVLTLLLIFWKTRAKVVE